MASSPRSDWWGTVTAVNAGPPKTVTVLIDGNTIATTCRYSASYDTHTPAVNDVLFGFVGPQGDYVAIDRLA